VRFTLLTDLKKNPELDLNFVRQHFSAFSGENKVSGHFFDSAAGSFPCLGTIECLDKFYRHHKVQPGNPFAISQLAAEEMAYAKKRWSEALGVKVNEVGFGPSTTQNIYVLANAFRETWSQGDEIIMTNQDHESNIGAMNRAAKAAGVKIRIWSVDPETGSLAKDDLEALLTSKTRLVCFTHSSNIVGQQNYAKELIEIIHSSGALALVDGVSYVPHEIPDIGDLGADIYVFSLYKVYSVHQGVLVMKEAVIEALPKQGHYFKDGLDVSERFIPAGPDHAQIAASAPVLEYIETLAAHHGGPVQNLRSACDFASSLWRAHEIELVKPLLAFFQSANNVRLVGSGIADERRCPLVSFLPQEDSVEDITHILCDQNIQVSAGHFYAPRLLDAMGINPETGVIRLSMAHYNDHEDVQNLIDHLEPLF